MTNSWFMARSIPSRFISELPKKIINENIEGNLGADVSSYNQIDFDLSSNNSSYGPGFLRAKQNGIRSLNVYKNSQFEKTVSNANLNLSVGQRVFHQKFGMGYYFFRWR